MCFDPDVVNDSDIVLYYDKSRNIMVDTDGCEIRKIFKIISPNMLYLFKTKKQDMCVFGVGGRPVELVYTDLDYD